jgi:hypothetical protein
MKPIGIVLRRGEEMWENDGGNEFNKVYCKHMWKCHNETPLYNEYMLIKCKKEKSW